MDFMDYTVFVGEPDDRKLLPPLGDGRNVAVPVDAGAVGPRRGPAAGDKGPDDEDSGADTRARILGPVDLPRHQLDTVLLLRKAAAEERGRDHRRPYHTHSPPVRARHLGQRVLVRNFHGRGGDTRVRRPDDANFSEPQVHEIREQGRNLEISQVH